MPRVNLGKSPELRAREAALREQYGGFMNLANLAKEFGVTRCTAGKIAKSIPSYGFGKTLRYDVRDVAKLIEDSRNPAVNSYGRA